jgi:hypothetical protein
MICLCWPNTSVTVKAVVIVTVTWALTQLRRLIDGCPPRRLGFNPRTSHVGSLRALRFPLPILIPPNAPHSSIIWGWYNRPNSGRRTKWTQSHTTKNKKFWEELIAYFPWYDTGHVEHAASNNSYVVACVFVTAATFLPTRYLAMIGGFLPSRCLATIGGYT